MQFTWGLRTIAGFKRPIILTNGQYPGPLIDVTEGDRIIVKVQNNLQPDCEITMLLL
jgi:FtsP/CotA-like multicopper oxidase with cupredoxin domain